MKKSEIIEAFGGARQLALALGISVQAVHQWGDEVPPLRQRQINGLLSRFGSPSAVAASFEAVRSPVGQK